MVRIKFASIVTRLSLLTRRECISTGPVALLPTVVGSLFIMSLEMESGTAMLKKIKQYLAL
eukprot:SAG31_NODE_26997_length_433_cov_0.458084_1_plen_60_part_10